MNKKLLYTIGIIALVVLGYFALQEETPQMDTLHPLNSEQTSDNGLELIKDAAVIPFKKIYPIDEEWSLIINQFEPDAKISGSGVITSDSDQEKNPAIKVDFYKNGELIHYQIIFKEMPGFHSVKDGQKYLLDFIDYNGYNVMGDNSFAIESANIKIWRIK